MLEYGLTMNSSSLSAIRHVTSTNTFKVRVLLKKGKKEITLKEVRSYLEEVLDVEELDPKVSRRAELVDLWDNHYVPLLKRTGVY